MSETPGILFQPEATTIENTPLSIFKETIKTAQSDDPFPLPDTYFGHVTILAPDSLIIPIHEGGDIVFDEEGRKFLMDHREKLHEIAPSFAKMVDMFNTTLFPRATAISPDQSEYSGWFLQNIAALDFDKIPQEDYKTVKYIIDQYPAAIVSASRFLERPVTIEDLQNLIPESIRQLALQELSLDQQLDIAAGIVYYGRDAMGTSQDIMLKDEVFFIDEDGFLPVRRKNRPAASYKDPKIREFFLSHGHALTSDEIAGLLRVKPDTVDDFVRLAVVGSMIPSLRIADMAKQMGIHETMLVLPGFRRKRTCLATEEKTVNELQNAISEEKYGAVPVSSDDDDDLEPGSTGMAVAYEFSDGTQATFACKFDEWTAMTCVSASNKSFKPGVIYLPIGSRRFNLETMKRQGNTAYRVQIDASRDGQGVFLLNRECQNVGPEYVAELEKTVEELFSLKAA